MKMHLNGNFAHFMAEYMCEGNFSMDKSLVGEKGTKIKTDGGYIDIQHKTEYSPRSQSVVDFVVDEHQRGKGIGDKLLKHAKTIYKDLGGQVSSIPSLKVFYKNGFRNPNLHDKTFDDHVKEFHDNGGSLFMAANDHHGTPYEKAL